MERTSLISRRQETRHQVYQRNEEARQELRLESASRSSTWWNCYHPLTYCSALNHTFLTAGLSREESRHFNSAISMTQCFATWYEMREVSEMHAMLGNQNAIDTVLIDCSRNAMDGMTQKCWIKSKECWDTSFSICWKGWWWLMKSARHSVKLQRAPIRSLIHQFRNPENITWRKVHYLRKKSRWTFSPTWCFNNSENILSRPRGSDLSSGIAWLQVEGLYKPDSINVGTRLEITKSQRAIFRWAEFSYDFAARASARAFIYCKHY